jgi:hypothetical protein
MSEESRIGQFQPKVDPGRPARRHQVQLKGSRFWDGEAGGGRRCCSPPLRTVGARTQCVGCCDQSAESVFNDRSSGLETYAQIAQGVSYSLLGYLPHATNTYNNSLRAGQTASLTRQPRRAASAAHAPITPIWGDWRLPRSLGSPRNDHHRESRCHEEVSSARLGRRQTTARARRQTRQTQSVTIVPTQT